MQVIDNSTHNRRETNYLVLLAVISLAPTPSFPFSTLHWSLIFQITLLCREPSSMGLVPRMQALLPNRSGILEALQFQPQ
jgi:hypothetical protein